MTDKEDAPRPDDRAIKALAEMLKDATKRLPRLETVDSVVVSRRAWLHAEAPCPSCGLHLDPVKDLEERIYEDVTTWTGVRGTHRRCSAPFRLTFAIHEHKP
jgi:hypothetical protein